MKLATIEARLTREALKYEDYIIINKCVQEIEIGRDKAVDFLVPMADFIAQVIIADKE